jgi:tetratricopeptide (TPR) repeat protein
MGPSGPASPHRRALGWSVVIVSVAALAYLPAMTGGFVWDDDATLTNNPLIKASDGLFRFWSTTEPKDYWPVTYTVLWLEWRVWGMHTLGYHAVSLCLHIVESLLIWTILRRLQIPGALLAALIFAVHPVNVESVAWIAQQKNLLAMLFFLLSVYCFLRTDPAIPPDFGRLYRRGAGPWYWLSLTAFALGMASKGSIAMLPVVLLGLIAWRRRLRAGDILAAVPFFLISGVLIVVNVWFQQHGVTTPIRNATLAERILGAGAATWFYLFKAVLPIRLIPIYPEWHIRAANPLWWLPLLAAVGMTAALWRRRNSGTRPALFAWGYFCVMLVPVLGLKDVYFMKYALVADHYEHLAIIGVVAFTSAYLASAGREGTPAWGSASGFLSVILIGALGALTWRHCRVYSDIDNFYQAILDRNPSCWMAYNNLGALMTKRGRLPEALALFKESQRFQSEYPETYYNMGVIYYKLGKMEDAVASYREALRINPRYLEAYLNLGLALAASGHLDEAIANYGEALKLKPDFAGAQAGLGAALDGMGRLPEAIDHYEAALKIDPSDAVCQYNLGIALFGLGRLDEAMASFEKALQIRPGYADAHNNLGVALARLDRLPEAVAQFREALRINPNDPGIHHNLGSALRDEGQSEEASAEFGKEAYLREGRKDAPH